MPRQALSALKLYHHKIALTVSDFRISCSSTRGSCVGCSVFHRSGFYAWMEQAFSKRVGEDDRQTMLLREAWQGLWLSIGR